MSEMSVKVGLRGVPTTEHVWADVGRAPTLVLQQVILTHQVLPQAEVGDGDPVSPAEKHKVSGSKARPAQTENGPHNRDSACGAF